VKARLILVISVLFIIPGTGRADDKQYVFRQIAPQHELAQAWVTDVYQDYIGFIWIGTSDGLYRYDGYNFKLYRGIPGDNRTLTGNNINAILEDSNRNLWIATTKGVSRYDRENDYFYYSPDLPRENVTNLKEDTSGNVLFGTYNDLYIYLTSTSRVVRYQQLTSSSVPYNGNQQLFIDADNRILITGFEGIYEFFREKGTFSLRIPYPATFNQVTITSTGKDYKGTLWMGTRDFGLYYVERNNRNTLTRFTIPKSDFLQKGTILSILESRDSFLWIGTENSGIIILDLKKFYKDEVIVSHIKSENENIGLINNSVYSLYQDRQGNIWIGTYAGLNFYNPVCANFQHVKSTDRSTGLNNDIINVFFEHGNELWIGTESGINIYNKFTGRYSYITRNSGSNKSLSSNAVFAFKKDQEGFIWVGTWAGGLNKINPVTREIIRYSTQSTGKHRITNNNIFSITSDDQGNLWIATMGGGLNKYDLKDDSFTSYRANSADSGSLLNDWVRQVFFDSRKRLWVSTHNSLALMNRDEGTFYHFFASEDTTSISDNGALIIFEDSKRHMWFGTETGLHLFHEEDSTFSVYRSENGLPSNIINAILEDKEGNIWLSTNNGISKFIQGSSIPQKPVFENYNLWDGLQGNKFNQRSAIQDADGYLYFGGKNGFNRFDPLKIKKDENPPPVILTEFLLADNTELYPGSPEAYIDKQISLAKQVKLNYKQRSFTINYVALNYLIPQKNAYKYKLEGFEEAWNNAGHRHSATYTNLDPGKYTFHVIASNGSDVWNYSGTRLQIIILPPWYRTTWAYIGYFVIIFGMILLFRRLVLIRTRLEHELALQRVEKEKIDQVSRMKSRFFTNISHEFRTPLTLIISPLENLLSDINLKPSVSRQLNSIQKNAKRLLRLINQLLDISEIEADHMKLKVSEGDIIVYIKEIASLFRWLAGQKDIQYTIESSLDHYQGYFDSDKIEKICYNLLSNAFKFTPQQGKINLRLEITDMSNERFAGYLRIIVRDSGMGISDQEQARIFETFYRATESKMYTKDGSGVGLALVRGLVDVYRGEITVASKEGKGSEFCVYLPVQKSSFDPTEIITIKDHEIPLTVDIYDLEHGFIDTGSSDEKEALIKDTKEQKPIILIVEDHDELRKHLVKQFSQKYSVIDSGNGREALNLALEHIPDLIISDIIMPEMDGIELCSRLKSNEKTSHIPILLLTAKASDEDQLKGMTSGADAYLPKPFDNKLLMASVKNMIESRKKLKEKYSRNLLIEPTEISITSLDEKFLRKAISLVEKNISDPTYSVELFSRDIGMSRSHLHRKFVGLTGHSPSSFIRTIRMKRAAQLLTKGQLTVSEILFEVGIKSRSYFTKSFREQFGESPTDFAAKNKKSIRDNLDINIK